METVPASSYLLLHILLFQNKCKVSKKEHNIVRMQRAHLLLVSACHSDYLQVSKSKQCSETCQTAPFLFRTSGFSRQAGSTKKLPENSKEYYKSRKNDTTHSNGVVWSQIFCQYAYCIRHRKSKMCLIGSFANCNFDLLYR